VETQKTKRREIYPDDDCHGIILSQGQNGA
jgi:hypothetical protein